jgi:hypothetical protein
MGDVFEEAKARMAATQTALGRAQAKLGALIPSREELSGAPRALVDFAATARAVTDIFPPLGVGIFGGGIGIGCGVGWPLRAAHGPPRAFCGPGIGVAVVAAGYGQGMAGVRWGHDLRAAEAKANIARVERWILRRCASVAAAVSGVVARVRGTGRGPERPRGGRGGRRTGRHSRAFVAAPEDRRFLPPGTTAASPRR